MRINAQILIVEDEAAQQAVLAYNLTSAGYETVQAVDGDKALQLIEEQLPDLILLDWMLPGTSGIEICRQLKVRKDTQAIPIIMLSARSEELDKVRGLETGADDYLQKPYGIQELLARIKLQLKRTRPATMGAELQHDDLRMDTETQRVWYADREITLGRREYALLLALIEQPGKVFKRVTLLDQVWGREFDGETRTVDVHIGRLRKVLTQFGAEDVIRTVRGSGYALY
ncbi:phosphate regulon transcriptional regulator PhoB [Planktomarina sp.]|jgi:two-component system phosphate regulon response regulator PhoB|nr:phosphate regulon transcriptional regulator PhoB [Planktomarina sp.]MDB4115979.1 phosphate regulon transcriptional regulator PhoB [Planktomarina sp.]|tara:strand:- start:1181 stop:1867 length:687 start_codon:yes stop_codon:yes gene_type:complete